jgi:hypothetical protein
MCLLYRNESGNFKLAKVTMWSRLGRNEEDWKRQINWSCNTHMNGNNTRKLPVYLSLYQTSKTSCFLIYLLFFLLQNRRTGGRNRLAGQASFGAGGRGFWWGRMNMMQTVYTHVCKCKNEPVETVPGIRGGE